LFKDPNTVTQLGIGTVFVLLALKEIFTFLKEMRSTKNKEDGSTLLTEKEHITQCELASLRMEKHFKKHFDKLKDDIFKELRKLENAIARVNKENGGDENGV
jgi:hypothetical protein